MLIERYDKQFECFECFDSELRFIAFTGYGSTKEKARHAYYSKQVIMESVGLINLKCTA